MALDIQGAMDGLLKIKANLAKEKGLEKSKEDAVKDLDRILIALRPVVEKKKKIDEKIAAIKTLNADIAAYNAALEKVTADARAGAKTAGGFTKADTPKRDF